MTKLIREVGNQTFFKNYVSFSNRRYAHLEAAAKVLLIENTVRNGGDMYCDVKKKYLDGLVKNNKVIPESDQETLRKRTKGELDYLCKVFARHDPLIGKQAYIPAYYLFFKSVKAHYGDPKLTSLQKVFLPRFQAMRIENLTKPEDERDPYLAEYGRLSQQGTNDKSSLQQRVSILTRFFLRDNPSVEMKDTRRDFNEDERYAIWVLGEKRCANCNIDIKFDEMHADHQEQFAFGGKTSITNGRCLCGNCNLKLAQHVS